MNELCASTAEVIRCDNFELRKPQASDGMAINQLVKNCHPLDTNSVYCNLLQCHHFADTAVIAERTGKIEGFITGYRLPNSPETLFVWQMAVSEDARGHGLALKMLHALLSRKSLSNIHYVHTTINPGNTASDAIFTRLANDLNASTNTTPLFTREQHFAGEHETEILHAIGPFSVHPSKQS